MEVTHSPRPIERNVAMELVRVTEAAALSAARFFGMGDKNLVDQAAVEAMRYVLGYSQDGWNRGHRRGRERRGSHVIYWRADR